MKNKSKISQFNQRWPLSAATLRHVLIEEKIYPVVSKEELEKILTGSQSYEEFSRERKYHYMRSSYIHHYKAMLVEILM